MFTLLIFISEKGSETMNTTVKKSEFTAEELEMARLAYNAKMKKWRSENKDKIKQYQQRYWVNKALREAQKDV